MSYLFVALSYLIGSINFAYLVAKYKKLDISSSGSGNPGTSNVMRTIGKKYAAIVLIGDVLIGFLPIFLFDENLLLCGFAAVIGHIYPIFYKFKGGKGVATYIGVYIAFSTLNPLSYDLFETSYFLFLNIPVLAIFYFVVFKIFRINFHLPFLGTKALSLGLRSTRLPGGAPTVRALPVGGYKVWSVGFCAGGLFFPFAT